MEQQQELEVDTRPLQSVIIHTESRLFVFLASIAIVLSLINAFNGFIVNKQALKHINSSRKTITLHNCQEQNYRHKQAIDTGISRAIVDTLAPLRNCQQLIKQRYG